MSDYADSTQLSATFVVSADDLVATSRLSGRDAMPMIQLSAFAFAVIGIVVWGYSNLLGGLIVTFGVAAFAIPLVPGFWRFLLAWQAGDLIGERRHFIFDGEGFHEERAGIRHTTPWSAINVMRISRDGVVLLRHAHVVQVLPTRAFPSPDDVDRLIDIVSANASNVRIT